MKQDVLLEPENGNMLMQSRLITKKSVLSQHVIDFDHIIDWANGKILKSESDAFRHHVAESFLINQKACSCNVISRNDGANFLAVYSVFISNKYCLMYLTIFTCPLLFL